MPATLHWFKWEAYWTWFTGVALSRSCTTPPRELYLIDPQVMPLSKPWAIAIGIAFWSAATRSTKASAARPRQE